MTNWVKRASTLLMAAVLMGGLCACDDNKPLDSSSIAPSSQNDQDMAEIYGKHWDEEHDFDGRVFKIASTSEWNKPQATNRYTEELVERIEYYEDKWNCSIEWTVPSADGTEYYSLINSSVLSGKPLADMAYVNTWQLFPAYVKGGIVQELDSLGVFDWDDPKWDISQMETLSSYQGKKYGLCPVGSLQKSDIGWGIFFNKDMAATYSLPDLYELARDGSWTWDKMVEVAKQATKDTDGDGQTDIYGFTGWMDAFPFMYANGGAVVEQDANGNYRFAAADDKSVSAMEWYFNNLATSGSSPTAVDKFPYVVPQKGKAWDFPMTSFANQEVFMCSAAFWVGGSYFLNMDDEWGWVPFPKANADAQYISYRESSVSMCILNGVENPEDVALMFDAITDTVIGEDMIDEFFTDQFNDDESLEMLKLMLNSGGVKYCMMENFDGLTNFFWQAWDSVRAGNATPRSAMDSIKDAAQQKIDSVLSQEYTLN